MPTTYRFNLSSETASAVSEFAVLHKFDALKDYKEAWRGWCEENQEMVSHEARRLGRLGYTGDVLDKMYKAGRYYYRNPKKQRDGESSGRRKTYVGLDSEILSLMDSFLEDKLITSQNGRETKPSVLHEAFEAEYSDQINAEIERLRLMIGDDDVKLKIKKTFKNRYYVLLGK